MNTLVTMQGEDVRAALLVGGHIVWNEEDQVYDLTERGQAWLVEWCHKQLEASA